MIHVTLSWLSKPLEVLHVWLRNCCAYTTEHCTTAMKHHCMSKPTAFLCNTALSVTVQQNNTYSVLQ